MVTCTVLDGCTEPATLQATRPCTGCPATVGEIQAQLAAKTAELATKQSAIDGIRTQCERESRTPDDAETLILRVTQDELAQLLADHDALAVAAAAVAGDHTHPVFACAAHEDQLPS
jgi:hypothetical protein